MPAANHELSVHQQLPPRYHFSGALKPLAATTLSLLAAYSISHFWLLLFIDQPGRKAAEVRLVLMHLMLTCDMILRMIMLSMLAYGIIKGWLLLWHFFGRYEKQIGWGNVVSIVVLMALAIVRVFIGYVID